MRYTYWHRHPRNFANECSMLKATTIEQMRDLATQGYERLSVAEARRHLAWVNAENDAWGSNRAIGKFYCYHYYFSGCSWHGHVFG